MRIAFLGACGTGKTTLVEAMYKDLGLKDKLAGMSEDEQLQLLSTNGMLVKRPLVVGDDFVLTGFKEKEWESALL